MEEAALAVHAAMCLSLPLLSLSFRATCLGVDDIVELVHAWLVVQTYRVNVAKMRRLLRAWVVASDRPPARHVQGHALPPSRIGSERMAFLGRLWERHPITAGVMHVAAVLRPCRSLVRNFVAFCEDGMAILFNEHGVVITGFMHPAGSHISPRRFYEAFVLYGTFDTHMPCVYGEVDAYSSCMNCNPLSLQVAANASMLIRPEDRLAWRLCCRSRFAGGM